ncbi:MAG: hypothetical protein K9N62_01325 [Verrucomicrobia bacterium]|nr:hypothetical protein [Verrucomicrobiota bacterium]
MQPTKKILQLRQLLAERFPDTRGVSKRRDGREPVSRDTESSEVGNLLAGNLSRGEITELSCTHLSSGGALILGSLIRKACANHQWIGLIDGSDCFDPTPFENSVLSRMLWVRCAHAGQAMQAADLVLRDGNLPLVFLDLAMNSDSELRKLNASHWFRLQRLIERTPTALLVATPFALVSGAHTRFSLNTRFEIEDLTRPESELHEQLNIKLVHRRSDRSLAYEAALLPA